MAMMKSVLITGCSDGGIGGALALVFQKHGYHVFATARNLSKMRALATLPNVTLLTLDVMNNTHILSAVDAVTKETGGTLDYLINNSDVDIEEAKGLFAVNVRGPLAVTKGFSLLIIKAKGTIVDIASISGHVNVPWMGTYAASKRSLEIMSETLRLEVAPFDVTVLSVVTGAVKTNGLTYFEDWELPADSIYKPIEATIAERTRGHDGVKRMETIDYANKVADEITRGASGKVWRGSTAGAVKFGSVFLPQSSMDSSLIKGTGLSDFPKSR